jgi:hypothetical protein
MNSYFIVSMFVFWDVSPCGPVGRYQRFGATNCLASMFRAEDLKTEAVFFSETLVSTYKSTRRYNPKDQYQHIHCRENLKSHISCFILFSSYNA